MKALARLLLVVGLTIAFFPSTPAHINNSVQQGEVKSAVSTPDQPKTVQAKANESLPIQQEPSPQPQPEPKPETSHPTGCDHYTALVQKYFGDSSRIALKIAKAESGCNPLAVGDNYPIKGIHAPSCGLFQIRTLKGRPSCEELKKPETNVAWAHRLYVANGYTPWSVCKTKVRCR